MMTSIEGLKKKSTQSFLKKLRWHVCGKCMKHENIKWVDKDQITDYEADVFARYATFTFRALYNSNFASVI